MSDNREETIVAAVAIPALQSIVSGGFIGLAAGAVAWAADAGNPAALGLAGGATVAALAWFGLRSAWERRLESVLGVASLQPAAAAQSYNQVLRVELLSEGGRRGDWIDDLPGGLDNLIRFACYVTSGKPITTAALTGTTGIYTRGQYEGLRHELLERGLLRQRNPHDQKGGYELTARGRATFKGIANMSNQPTPREGLALARIEKQPSSSMHTVMHMRARPQ